MALDTGNYISDFDNLNPTSSDLVSQGDDVLRFIKICLQRTFPAGTAAYSGSSTTTGLGPDRVAQVLIAKSTAPTVDTSATGHAARAMGLIWLDTGNDLVKMRNQANDAWITLPFDPEVNQKVIALAGTIDGTIIGGTTAAAITGTTVVANTSVNIAGDGATVTGIKDEDDMSSDSAVKLATQQSIKAYVDTQLTAEDLDITTDSGTIDIDLDSDTLTVAGGAALDTSATGTTVTVNVTDEGITNAKLAHMAANTVKVRDANSTGDPSDVAVADTELLIGDGSGFATNTLSKDATLLSTGALTVTGIQGKAVSSTAPTDDQMLKYTTAGSGEWQMVSIIGDDKLTTKGDVLTYNTVDSETRMGVGTDDYVLMADSSASNNNGIDWKQVATDTIADDAVTLGKLEDGTQGDILYYGASGAPARLGFGTSGYFLKTQGTGADPIWAAESDTTYTAGDGLDLSGAEFSTDLLANGGLEIQSTELSVAQGISQYDVAQFASGVADNDFLKIDGTAVEGRSATELLSDVSSIDNSWTGSQRGTPSAVTDGTLDLDTANNFTYTPAANDDLEFSNETAGQAGFITLINPSAYTISLGSEVKKGSSWDVSTAGTYLVSYYSDGTSVYVSASEALS